MQDGGPPFGILFQSGALWTSMSVLENVTMPMDLQGYSIPSHDPALARFKLALVGLAGDEDRYPASLSGGDAQACRAGACARSGSQPSSFWMNLRRVGSR
jgi:ABC-type transporter Mla maintaining outer membrane lipid asymmetry ATPase subunit MlaF